MTVDHVLTPTRLCGVGRRRERHERLCASENDAFCKTKSKWSATKAQAIGYDGTSHFATPEDALEGLRRRLLGPKSANEGGTNYGRITLE